MSAELSLPDQIRQLDDARKLVLADVKYYPTIIQGILPVIGANARLELKRWGASFLAEAFGTPAIPPGEKETMQLHVLDMIQTMLGNPQEDNAVVGLLIQASASIYPMALRWNINNSYDKASWQKMLAIKTRIFQIWQTAVTPIRICCIKFAQRVILAQTNAGPENWYRGPLEVSLDKVPNDHENLDPRSLEGEAMGLLDRILSVLQENSSDALIVDATVNCLSVIARIRPNTTTRIVNVVLNFNPLKLANSPMTPRTRMIIKSIEKTSRVFLLHLAKRDPQHPLAARMQQQAEKFMRARMEVLDDRKRAAQESQLREAAEAKRQRLGTPVRSVVQVEVKPLGPGPHSLATLFTLVDHNGLQSFDVGRVPPALAARISTSVLQRLDPQLLEKAVTGIRSRLAAMAAAPVPELNPNTAPLGVEEEDDEYEPDFFMAEDTEQILNRLDSEDSKGAGATEDSNDALVPFTLPKPHPPTTEEAIMIGREAAGRVLDSIRLLPEQATKRPRPGFARPRPGAGLFGRDRDAWVKLICRVATRAPPPDVEPPVKNEGVVVRAQEAALSNPIRHFLYQYILEDFRKRIDSAIAWLCEEWHTDWRNSRGGGDSGGGDDNDKKPSFPNYETWALKLIDGFLPYVNAQDKLLTRFLSEIPYVNAAMLSRVKQLCRDPSVVSLALNSLLYLIMLKPPAKAVALDTIQDIWTDYDDAKTLAAKYLQRYRPEFMAAVKREKAASADPVAVGA